MHDEGVAGAGAGVKLYGNKSVCVPPSGHHDHNYRTVTSHIYIPYRMP